MTLPAELEQLTVSYDQLIDSVAEGHISQEDALSTLSALSVTDPDGGIWALNADGDFVRSPFPGAPAQVTDPAYWPSGAAGPALPHPTTFPGPASFPGAAGFPGGTPFPHPAQEPDYATDSSRAQQSWASPAEAFAQEPPASAGQPGEPLSAATPLPDLDYTGKDKLGRSLADADRGSGRARAPWLDVLLRKANENRVLLGILVVGAVIVAILSQKGGSDGGTTLPSTAPTVPAHVSTTAGGTLQVMPTGGSGTTAPAKSLVPTPAQSVAVISELQSKKDSLFRSVVADTSDRDQLVRAEAAWFGSADLGLTVKPGPAAAAGDGAVQDWAIYQGSHVVTTIKVNWVNAGGIWKVATAPTF